MPITHAYTDGPRLCYSTKETAAEIRAALKKSFPSVKFSVRVKTASMYSATEVFWTAGPAQADVHAVTDQFSSKTFDAMDDSTHYHSQTPNGVRVQYAGWINLHRSTQAN